MNLLNRPADQVDTSVLGGRGTEAYRTATVVGGGAAAIYLLLSVLALSTTSYDIWFGLVGGPILFGLGFPFLTRVLKRVEPDSYIRHVVMLGYGAKLLGAYARFFANEFVLGRGDAFVYHNHGAAVSAEFRSFLIGGPAFQEAFPDLIGTQFIRLLVSLLYTVFGTSRLGGFVLFSLMSFWGLFFFYRAFSLAVEDGQRRRYAVLLFFLPSMVFWPSSVGKEAWMTTMLGLGAYGLARLIRGRPVAYPLIVAAVAGLTAVRPHVAALFVVALAGAFFTRRTSSGIGGAWRKVFGLLVLSAVTGFVLLQLQGFFGLEEGLDAQEVLERTSDRTSQGGSEFEAAQPNSVTGLPWATVTVLFRPFLFEAGSAAGLVTALEGTALMVLFLWNLPRLTRLPGMVLTRPYITFVAIYTLSFVFAFSAISNFGILARQRTQLFPIAITLVAVPFEPKLRTRDELKAGGQGRGAGSTDPDSAAAPATDYEPIGPRYLT